MFESDLVDFFSRTHFSVVPILYLPASAWLLWKSAVSEGLGWGVTLGLAVAAFGLWTLIEYWLHRSFFHWEPGGKWGERMHFWVHGVHHKWPKDRFRLVMPPAVSIALFWLFLGVEYLLLGGAYVWGFHAGMVLGYTYYDLTHYYLHHAHPKTKYGKELKRNHMLHHFRDNGARYGVSWMIWDYVFGTRGEPVRSPRGHAVRS
jgi:sterol desaturase/sphingolipid hydroxylase (fatty acid hydroxylase superfamily)